MRKIYLMVALLFVTYALSAQWRGITGEGPKVKKTLQVAEFDRVSLSISGDLYIRQGNTQSVEIEAQQNIIDNIRTEVKDDRWKIRFDRNVRRHSGVTIWVTVTDLEEVGLSGSGSIRGENKFSVDDLWTSVSGSGDLTLEVEASGDLAASISGSGNIDLEGSSRDLEVSISGSGNVDAEALTTATCEVHVSGSGNTRCHATESLTANISGSGDVYYRGNPHVKARVSGSGDVQSLDMH
jgi:hypothetical protein